MFQHPLFEAEYEKLLTQAEKIKARQPDTYQNHKTVRLLARITDLITKEIPEDPERHNRWNQGNTLVTDHRHWKRAKFGKDRRYRLFFRYDAKSKEIPPGKGKAIIYVWINDDKSMRKEGDKNDPYAIFARGLKRGQPPDSFDTLMKESETIDAPSSNPQNS
ncbi:MAG: type II toxin-antitoxin system YhaV family toxin [Candidatus Melainabacteria bacterium]|nr:type II toxin-antitoxin system YhaV family toxin [Candidatus Melainabacteria bacterium]